VTPTERRALTVLLFWLLASLAFDYLRTRQPGRVTAWLGPEHARELGVAETPPTASGHAGEPAPNDTDAVTPGDRRTTATRARLPYDASGRLLVNDADSAGLLSLRGVGPVMAGRILEWRRRRGRLHGPDDLLSIRGIGPATLDRLLPQISFAGTDSSAPGPRKAPPGPAP